jgi:hypothetical protein
VAAFLEFRRRGYVLCHLSERVVSFLASVVGVNEGKNAVNVLKRNVISVQTKKGYSVGPSFKVRWLFSGMLHRVVWWILTGVSEKLTASIITVMR